MSSKTSRKNAAKSNTIVTRTKAAKIARQLRAKNKKPIKTIDTKEVEVIPEIKSTKLTKSGDVSQDTPLKCKVRQLVELVEQVEYHPDKLKREVSIKKIMLKPKHNFKVIASANKRKLGVPQKGGGMPLKKPRCNSGKEIRHSEISMADMVRLIEDNHTLSDEDFMEILTCPSPVWWEDPPDDRYTEDAICKRTPVQSSPITVSIDDSTHTNEQTNNGTNTPTDNQQAIKDVRLIDFENEIEEFKITPNCTKDVKFINKKRKLEDVLGNIKNGRNNKKDTIINGGTVAGNDIVKPRRISTATDGEELSDLSLNEEEMLKNLENITIPIEKPEKTDNKIEIDIQGTETIKKRIIRKKIIPIPIKKEAMPRITVKKFAEIPIKNELIVPDKMPPLIRKPDLNVGKSDKLDKTDYLDNVSLSRFKFIPDDDVTLLDLREEKPNVGVNNSSKTCIELDTIDNKKEEIEVKKDQSNTANTTGKNSEKEFSCKKAVRDLAEFITVYKIMSNENDKNVEKPNKNTENSTNNDRGQLNSFFKKRKSNKRAKKSDSPFPAISLTDVKEVAIDNVSGDVKTSVENDENRLKPCDNCVVKTEDGLFACDSCDFAADTKEIYKKHVSSCKDVTRIPWNNNLVANQT